MKKAGSNGSQALPVPLSLYQWNPTNPRKRIEMSVTKTEMLYKETELLHVENQYLIVKAERDQMVEEYELELEQNFVPSSLFTTKDVEIGGTHGQGSIIATREEMMKTFGAPTYCEWDSGDKTTIEWDVKFNDGTIATIYDWKRCYYGEENDPIGLFEEFEWNIGGNSEKAVEAVRMALALRNERKIYANN
jgi:hypothetical protein